MPQPFEASYSDPGFVSGPQKVSPAGAVALGQQGEAIERIGGELDSLAGKFEHAQQMTALNQATADGLDKFNALRAKYQNDPDFQNARANFEKDSARVTEQTLANSGLDPLHQSELQLRLTRDKIHAGGTIEQSAWTKEQAANVANISRSNEALQNTYLTASSPVAKAAVFDEQARVVSTAVSGGWIDQNEAEKQIHNFRAVAQYGEALRQLKTDPMGLQTRLNDAGDFPYLPPDHRASLLASAINAHDSTAQLYTSNLALRAPERAALLVGKASDPQTVAAIYDNGVIPQESSGKADAVSPAGALGVGQLMLDTARATAQRLKLTNVASLSDADLKTTLLQNPKLNRQLGLAEFQRLVDHFDGDIPAALAGYNAGQGNSDKPRADAWRQQAIEKFGPNYTPEQFASVIPIKETRDYVLSVYQRLGAPMDALGMSANARLAAQRGVDTGIATQENERVATYRKMAEDAVTDDPIADQLKGGQYVAPERIAAQRQVLTTAAATGDSKSIAELRRLNYAEEAAPIMRAAYEMKPSELVNFVSSEEDRLANGGGTPFDTRQLDAVKTVMHDVMSRYKTDPLGLGERGGNFTLSRLPIEAPQSAEFARVLRERNMQSNAVADLYDGARAPIRPGELPALQNLWKTGSIGDRLALSAQIAGNLTTPDNQQAAMKQVAGNDPLSLVAGQMALRNPELGRKIMDGQHLVKEKDAAAKAGDVRAALGDVLKGDLYPSLKLQRDAIEAGLAVYASNRNASSSLFSASDRYGIEDALQEVTGKIVNINGRRTPIPPGTPPGAVLAGIADLQDGDIPGGVQPGLDLAAVAAHGQLHPLELGGTHYAVTLGGRPVMDGTGTRPLVIDMAEVAARQQARAKLTYSSTDDAAAKLILAHPVAFK